MRFKSFFTRSIAGAAMLLAAFSLQSCEENDIDPTGSANLKVVNAAPGAASQSFYLVDKTIVDGLGFTEASGFISTVAGTRLTAQFRNDGSSSGTADGELYLLDNKHYTVYLRGDDNLRVKQYEDDLSLPPADMARVKFLHFADGLPGTVVIKDGSGDKLINTLVTDVESKYVNVAAGTLALQIESLATQKNVATLNVSGLKGGTVYAIYFTGSSSSNIAAHLVEY